MEENGNPCLRDLIQSAMSRNSKKRDEMISQGPF